MKTKTLLIVGALFGALWSIVPIIYSGLIRSAEDTVTAVVAGCMTGAILSWVIVKALSPRVRIIWIIVTGALSLPVGAFLFGLTISYIQLGYQKTTGTSLRLVEHQFAPIDLGLAYAIFGSLAFGFVLIPLAIVTTFLLMWIIKKIGQQSGSPYSSPAAGSVYSDL
ncbi:MAG: hypothetical protein JJU29_05200 [Verrucomicrobia bacterium]|nr:hypothetical protein [Verrucomicrobiota bacterium]MCH8514051.1 hypothetical protein [Kiritimatiellia bacterium]